MAEIIPARGTRSDSDADLPCGGDRALPSRWARVGLAVLLVSCCVGCANPDHADEGRASSAHEAVIAHLRLDPEFGTLPPNRMTLLIDGMSRMPPWTPEVGPWTQAQFAEEWAAVQGGLPGVRRETWDALIAANKSSRSLASAICDLEHIHLVTSEEEAKLFLREEPWLDPSIITSCDSGVISMTTPGITSDGSQALMFLAYWCGPLCGWGRYYLLTRRDGQWVVAAAFQSWIS